MFIYFFSHTAKDTFNGDRITPVIDRLRNVWSVRRVAMSVFTRLVKVETMEDVPSPIHNFPGGGDT